jgi:two-component system phosphate regulon sensor histidine kinase PhoR
VRFATRLTIVMALLAAGSAIALSSIVSRLVDRSVEERSSERLQRESSLLATEIAPVLGEPLAQDRIARRAALDLGARITVIRPDGVVTADSGVTPAELSSLENHARRPEVAAARSNGSGFSVRHSATLRRDLFYLARRIDQRGDVVRLALPYDDLLHIESQYEWGARAAIALVCALLFVTGSVAVRSIARPIRQVSDAALAVAAGDTDRTLPEEGLVEIVELSSAINRMKKSLLDAAARIERERQLGAAVFETLPDGVVVVDRQWRIVDANARLRELLHADCAAGLLLVDVLRDRDLFAPFEEAVKSGRSAHGTVARAGDVTWEVSVHPLSGGAAAAVGIIHDVTSFRQNESMRRRFVSDISHELRTPVASIAAAAETLASLGAGGEERPLIDVIARQTGRMRELLDDLTDLTLIESGQIVLERGPVDLTAVAREVAADVQPAAQSRHIGIVVEGQSARIEGDRRRIAQIVRNLIDNAIKFSADGTTVRVSVEGGDNEAVLSVADSGEGIPERELSRIFQRFYQVDRSRSKVRPGSGLGLAIVKHLGQLHSATVDVESAVGVGSTFRVRFPRIQEEA